MPVTNEISVKPQIVKQVIQTRLQIYHKMILVQDKLTNAGMSAFCWIPEVQLIVKQTTGFHTMALAVQ